MTDRTKRAIDLAGSAVGLVILAPVLLPIGIIIRCDSRGGAIFRQERVGQYGKSFTIMKFRTMKADSVGPPLTANEDDRITRVGKLLRAYRIDELLQLVNVLRGEMSLVGPRPEVSEFVEHWPREARMTILALRPGITDPASLHFRNEAQLLAASNDPRQTYIREILPIKVAMYKHYAENRTNLGDLIILTRTLKAMINDAWH